MRTHGSWLRRVIAPLATVSALVALAACSDTVPTAASVGDDWADRTVVGLEIQNEVSLITDRTLMRLPPTVERVPSKLLAARGFGIHAASEQSGRKTRTRHFRGRDGRVFSFASVSDGTGAPSRRHYFFENGRIRAVASYGYSRRDGHWLTTASRLSVFDSTGRPLAQVTNRLASDAQAMVGALAQNSPLASQDATASAGIAAMLLGDEGEEAACASEWLAVGAASLVLAELMAVLTTLAATCAEGVVLSCAAIPSASGKVLAAMAGVTLTWDRLAECRKKDAPNYDGGGGGDEAYDDDYADYEDTRRTVDDFIDEAEEAGRFACFDGGNRCVYYAE